MPQKAAAHGDQASVEFEWRLIDRYTVNIDKYQITQHGYDEHVDSKIKEARRSLTDLNTSLLELVGEYRWGVAIEGGFIGSDIDQVFRNSPAPGKCQSEIKLVGLVEFRFTEPKPTIIGTDCAEVISDDLPLTDLMNKPEYNIYFAWQDPNVIYSLSDFNDKYGQLEPEQQPNRFYRLSENISDANIDYVDTGGSINSGTWYERKSGGEDNVITVGIRGDPSLNPATDPDQLLNGGGLDLESNTCASAGGMSWIICPVIQALDGAFNWIDSRIQSLLKIDTNKYRDEDLRSIWAVMRNLAYILLVPIMMVMVIGTALGFDFISAYTVKKALPRLIAATLFIALSWELTGFMIEISNTVGEGVLGLMTYPLDPDLKGVVTLNNLFEISAGGSLTQLIGVGGVGAGVVLLAGSQLLGGIIMVIFLFILSAVLVILSAFLVIIARQILLLVLIIFAPLAILSWIFPGNDKLWKGWWGTFSKLLIMYPLIMALIGAGRVFAAIIGNVDSSSAEGALLNPVLKLVAYTAPYFMIPLTFKFAGGLIGNLAGVINNREKGLFDRLKKGRANTYGNLKHAAKDGHLIHGGVGNTDKKGTRSQRFNRFTRKASRLGSLQAGTGVSWKDQLAEATESNVYSEVESAEKDHPEAASWTKNDSQSRAASEFYHDEEGLRKSLTNSLATLHGVKDADGNNVLDSSGNAVLTTAGQASLERQMNQISSLKSKMSEKAFRMHMVLSAMAGGTAYKNTAEAWEAAQQAADSTGADDDANAYMIAKGRSALMSAGRVDEAGHSFGAGLTAVRQIREGVSSEKVRSDLLEDVIKSQGAGTLIHASMKPTAIKEIAVPMLQRIKKAYNKKDANGNITIDQDEADRALASFAGLQDQLNASSPQNAAVLADIVMTAQVIPDTQTTRTDAEGNETVMVTKGTVQGQIEARRETATFQETRKEWASAQARYAATGGGGQPPQPGDGPTPGPPPTGPSGRQ